MDTPSPVVLASMVLAAPGSVRMGIAVPSEPMQEAAARKLGALIAELIEQPVATVFEDQLALKLSAIPRPHGSGPAAYGLLAI